MNLLAIILDGSVPQTATYSHSSLVGIHRAGLIWGKTVNVSRKQMLARLQQQQRVQLEEACKSLCEARNFDVHSSVQPHMFAECVWCGKETRACAVTESACKLT